MSFSSPFTLELPVLSNPPDSPNPDAPHAPSQARPISPSRAREILQAKKPEWLRIRPPGGEAYTRIKGMLRERGLHTVCEEAHCPNVAECWASGTATFMLGGDTCTRACRFCAIKTARIPPPLDPNEPLHVAESIVALGLRYVVLTSVDRDDLPDGGAGHFAATIREIKRLQIRGSPVIVEALVPDFRGDTRAIETIVDSGVDVYAHNVETVESLQYRVRDPRAGYAQSLGTLRYAKAYARGKGDRARLFTKSSLMLGLGERDSELGQAFADLRAHEVDVLTLGQYLRPSSSHLPVDKFVSPEDFARYEREAQGMGFLYVASGPMVRSSYRAAELFLKGKIENAIQASGTR